MKPRQLSKSEYRVLVEKSPIMIWRSNSAAECDYFNDRWLRFRGRSMEQECGKQWAEGVHAEDRQPCVAAFLAAFQKREPFEMQYRLRRYDGAYRWILDSGSPVFEDTGKFQGFIGSCIDITERIEAKRAVDRELSNLRGLLPICMVCKKIRDSDGVWHQLELFISSHSNADFTHGICTECAKDAIR